MKVIQRAQQISSYAGITAEQSLQKIPLNVKSGSALLVLSLSTILCVPYVLYDANTFLDYTYSIALLSSLLITTASFAIIVWKTKATYKFLWLLETGAVAPSSFECYYIFFKFDVFTNDFRIYLYLF